MAISKWLKQDKISLGILLGFIIPFPVALLFAAIIRLLQYSFHVLNSIRDVDILLLGIAVNLVIMRFYFIRYKCMNTGKGLLIVSASLVILFFIFIRNSNFVFPF